MWGVSESGGVDGIGSVFSLYDDGSTYNLSSSFLKNNDGASPRAQMTLGDNGIVYGITSAGGVNGSGAIFSYSETNGVVPLFNLESSMHGSNARSPLVQAGPSTFVGTCSQGGNSGGGTLFEYDLQNGYTVLHHFDSPLSGSSPRGRLIYDSSSNVIYGITSNGGDDGFGLIYKYSNADGLEVLHHFSGGDGGSFPQGGLCLASSGLLYGCTQFGGSLSQGSIYSYDTENEFFATVYSLSNVSSDGRYPFGALIALDNGNLLGTCSEGGPNGVGTIFSVTPSGVYTRLHSFISGSHGAFPKSGLVHLSGNDYYGVSEFGGSNGFGTAFRYSLGGSFTKLRDLNYTQDGSNPVAELVVVESDILLGLAAGGGSSDAGTIFELSAAGEMEKIHDFALPGNGAFANGLIEANDSFFGHTRAGGEFNAGTFFSINLSGERTKLFDFENSLEGRHPNEGLLQHIDGLYYGTARFGGPNNAGSIFSLSPDGEFTLLHAFGSSANGQFPFGGLASIDDGFFYGTTISGGLFGNGTLYKVSPEGIYTKLADFFSFFEGGSPEAELVATAGGTFLGLASTGGDFGAGTLYEFNPANNAITVLHHFDGGSQGGTPLHQLLAHGDGHFYGTCTSGGNGSGTLYRYSSDGGFEVLHSFDSAQDGAIPSGALTASEEGVLFGFCREGGSFNQGTCFTYSSSDGFSKIFDFSSDNSASPVGSPKLFAPECFADEECPSSDPCSVGLCSFGLCTQVAISPVFSVVQVGTCDPNTDTFSISLILEIGANPGGALTLGGSNYDLPEGSTTIPIVLEGLPSNGAPVDLSYTFEATGCTGTTGFLANAPTPCPPVTANILLDLGGFSPGPSGIYLGGSWQNWNPAQNSLTQIDENLWEITLGIPSGTHEFNFFDGPTLFNAEYVIGSCALNGKRILEMGDENQSFSFCWGICAENCTVETSNSEGIDMNLWPNPASQGQEVNVQLSETSKQVMYRIYDAIGKEVGAGAIPSSGLTHIATEGFAKGMYTILLMTTSGESTIGAKRFVLQ